MQWHVFVENKATGTRSLLGTIETPTPLLAIQIAAEAYACDPSSLVVSTFIPWGYRTCQVWISLTEFWMEGALGSLWWYHRLFEALLQINVSLWLSWLSPRKEHINE